MELREVIAAIRSAATGTVVLPREDLHALLRRMAFLQQSLEMFCGVPHREFGDLNQVEMHSTAVAARTAPLANDHFGTCVPYSVLAVAFTVRSWVLYAPAAQQPEVAGVYVVLVGSGMEARWAFWNSEDEDWERFDAVPTDLGAGPEPQPGVYYYLQHPAVMRAGSPVQEAY